MLIKLTLVSKEDECRSSGYIRANDIRMVLKGDVYTEVHTEDGFVTVTEDPQAVAVRIREAEEQVNG